MTHNDYSFRDVFGQPSNPIVPTPAVLRALDLAASQSIDGDDGGTWNPAAPIIIGGAGLSMTGYAQMTGGLATGPQAPPRAIVTAVNQPALFLAGTRTRTAVFPLRDFSYRQDEIPYSSPTLIPYDESGTPGIVAPTSAALVQLGTVLRLQCRLPTWRCTSGNAVPGGVVVNVSPTLRMRVGQSVVNPAAVGGTAGYPAGQMPGFRLFRIGSNGVVVNTSDLVIPTWSTLNYSLGSLVIPAAPNGRQFRCIVAGTSGASQPAGFSSAATGTTVTDNTVTWLCEVGPATANYHYITLPLPTTGAGYYAHGQWQDIALPPNMGIGSSFFTVGNMGGFYGLDILDPTNTQNSFQSLRIAFTASVFTPAI